MAKAQSTQAKGTEVRLDTDRIRLDLGQMRAVVREADRLQMPNAANVTVIAPSPSQVHVGEHTIKGLRVRHSEEEKS